MATSKSSSSTKSSDNKLKLNIDYKTLLALLPTVLSIIGTVTKKDEKKGTFEIEKEDSSGGLLGYVLNLVGNKDGSTTVDVQSANDTKEEKSGLGDILSSLGKLSKLTGNSSSSSSGGDLMSMIGSLTGGSSKKEDSSGDLMSMLSKLL